VQLLGADDADKPVAQEFSLEKKVDGAELRCDRWADGISPRRP